MNQEKSYPLMRNNISKEDLSRVIQFLEQEDPILTQASNVRCFEEEWSNWLGVKYSVFVNSGSSANQLTMAALRHRFPEGGEVVVPPLTWSSDISAVLQAGFTPVFADINPHHLGMDTDEIVQVLTENTRAVFLTHVQGFNALTDRLIEVLDRKNIVLIEDVCESHGATHNGEKIGSFGLVSNFSFYYAHHMSTIEGGMLCTNDNELYETFRMLRSHGMVRETTSPELKEQYLTQYPDLNPDFIFAFPAYNVRNTEIGAIIGRSQLPRLDAYIKLRSRNQALFLENLDPAVFRTDFLQEGSSNYAFNVIQKEPDDDLCRRLTQRMQEEGIEFRKGSAGGGNQLRQPYLRERMGDLFLSFPETEHIHFYGFYIGNYPTLAAEDVIYLASVLNNA